MMECTSNGSTSLSWAAFSTISVMRTDGAAVSLEADFAAVTLRTSFPVRRSARTTRVFCDDGLTAALFPAAPRGEAASIMASAVMKQIYTVLFVNGCVNVLPAIATIISWPVSYTHLRAHE